MRALLETLRATTADSKAFEAGATQLAIKIK